MMFDGYPARFDHRAALRSLASAATPERKAAIVDDIIERLPEQLTDMEDLQMADLLLRGLTATPEQGDPA